MRALSELAGEGREAAKRESLAWWYTHRIASRLTSSATIQAQIQGFESAHPNLYLIYDMLEHVKEPVV